MVVLQYPVVRLLRRRDHMIAAVASCVASALGVGGGARSCPGPATFACIVSIALGLVLLIPISSTVVSRLAPVALRGRYMGAWTLVYMGGYALGPLLGGWALDALGGRAAFAVVTAAASWERRCSRSSVPACARRMRPAEGPEAGGSARRGSSRGERPEQAV